MDEGFRCACGNAPHTLLLPHLHTTAIISDSSSTTRKRHRLAADFGRRHLAEYHLVQQQVDQDKLADAHTSVYPCHFMEQ